MALTRLYGAIGEALRTAASAALTGPLAGVIVVEDAHWADGPSLDLLAYLVRRLPGWPLLLVISCSTEHAERLRGLRAALSEASDAGRGTVVEPAPLGEEQIRDLLLRSGVRDADVGRLLAQTRGLPMLVREYVEGLRSGAGDGGEHWWPPASVRELLRRRLQAASEPTLQMLSTAAVLGSGCDADLLRAVSGRGETETVEALDEAVRRFLITETPPAGDSGVPRYDFPYEALREVVYESATLARRRLLHGRAAGVLIRRYERDPVTTRAAAIAEHLQRAGRDSEAAAGGGGRPGGPGICTPTPSSTRTCAGPRRWVSRRRRWPSPWATCSRCWAGTGRRWPSSRPPRRRSTASARDRSPQTGRPGGHRAQAGRGASPAGRLGAGRSASRRGP